MYSWVWQSVCSKVMRLKNFVNECYSFFPEMLDTGWKLTLQMCASWIGTRALRKLPFLVENEDTDYLTPFSGEENGSQNTSISFSPKGPVWGMWGWVFQWEPGTVYHLQSRCHSCSHRALEEESTSCSGCTFKVHLEESVLSKSALEHSTETWVS